MATVYKAFKYHNGIKIYVSILSWIFETSTTIIPMLEDNSSKYLVRWWIDKEQRHVARSFVRERKRSTRFALFKKRRDGASRQNSQKANNTRWDGGGWHLSKRITSDATSRDKVAWVSFVIADRASSYVLPSAPAGARSSLVPAESRCSDPVSPNVSRQIYDPSLR